MQPDPAAQSAAPRSGRARTSSAAPQPAAAATQPDPLRALKPGEPRYHSLWRPRPDGAWFDDVVADNAVTFFERYTCLTTDEWAGRPFKLEPWQAEWIIRPAFGWMRADGTRLYRRVIVWIPRKNGKTELMAGIAHLLMIGDGVHGAECYSIASSEDQAKMVFKAARTMALYMSSLGDLYEINVESLFSRSTSGLFRPLTGKPRGKHGLKTTYLIGDEVHEWADDKLYTYVRNAMASRRAPMEWLISTAGVDQGYGVTLWDDSLGICQGTFDDPETLVLIWCAPQDAKAEIDVEDETVWAEANPNLGVSLRQDYMIKTAREAAQNTARENDFKRYHLNIWVGQDERWLPMPAWNACTSSPDGWRTMADRLTGRRCVGGLDLASTRDINALVWLFPPETDEEVSRNLWHVLPRFWWPQMRLAEAAQKSRLPFESWAKSGAILTTPGNAADHTAIGDAIVEDCHRFSVQGLGIDKFNAHGLATRLFNDDGVPVKLIRFGLMSMSGPSKALEMKVIKGQYDHGAHPVLRWMAGNVAIRRDNSDNYMPAKPDKAGAHNKIDGIAALAMAELMATDIDAATSYLSSGELLSF